MLPLLPPEISVPPFIPAALHAIFYCGVPVPASPRAPFCLSLSSAEDYSASAHTLLLRLWVMAFAVPAITI